MAEEQRRNLEQEISDNARQLRSEWDHAMAWLVDYGFVEPSREGGDGCGTLTARGNACAAFADGHPLIVGTIIADGWLPQLSQAVRVRV